MLEWIASSCLLILAVLGLRAGLGKRISPGLRYGLWAVVLLRLLVPVQLFTSPLAGMGVVPPPPVLREESLYVLPVQTVPAEDAAPLAAAGEGGLILDDSASDFARLEDEGSAVRRDALRVSPLEALGIFWLLGSAALGMALAASNLGFALRLRRVRKPLEGAGRPVPVYLAEGLPSPCLFGLFRPAIYITPETAGDPDMLRHILAHELTHFRHMDHVWSALRGAALAIHWWNPLVWLAAVCSRRDAELACDAGALKRLGDGARLAYGETLLTLVTARTGPRDLLSCATTMSGEKRSLQRRIMQIARKPKALVSATIAAVLLLTAFSVVAFGTLEEDASAAPAGMSGGIGTLPYEVDLDRDGTLETLRLTREGDEVYTLEVVKGRKVLWSDTMDATRQGCDTYFLCQSEGLDYLLEYRPVMLGQTCSYAFRLFHLEGREVVVDQEQNIDFSIYNFSSLPAAGISGFMKTVNGLLAESTLLVNTNSWGLFLEKRQDGTLYDNIVHVFDMYSSFGPERPQDPSDSEALETFLTLYQECRMYAGIDSLDTNRLIQFLASVRTENIGDISGQDRVDAAELTRLLQEAAANRVYERRGMVSQGAFRLDPVTLWSWGEADWTVPLAGGGKLHLIATTTPGELAIAAEASTRTELAFYRCQELYDLALALGTDIVLPDALPYTPDLNHDGEPDRLVLRTDGKGGYVLQCMMKTDGGRQVWEMRIAGGSALFLCQEDGWDYLFRYVPSVGERSCSYVYQLFWLDTFQKAEAEELVRRDNSVFFALDPDTQARTGGQFNARRIALFFDEGLNPILENCTLLANTDPALAETFQREGRLYDSISWLAGRGSLFERLTAFWNEALAQAAVPTLREIFSGITADDILSPRMERKLTPSVLAKGLNSAQNSPAVEQAQDFPEKVTHRVEVLFTRAGDSGEQHMTLECGEQKNLVRVTVSGQATATLESMNYAVPGRYLRDVPYEYTAFVRNEVLYNCLDWYTETLD